MDLRGRLCIIYIHTYTVYTLYVCEFMYMCLYLYMYMHICIYKWAITQPLQVQSCAVG